MGGYNECHYGADRGDTPLRAGLQLIGSALIRPTREALYSEFSPQRKPYHAKKYEYPMTIHAIQHSRHRAFLSVKRWEQQRRKQMSFTTAELALH